MPKKFEHGSNEHTNQINRAVNKFYEAGIKSVTVVLSSKPLEMQTSEKLPSRTKIEQKSIMV